MDNYDSILENTYSMIAKGEANRGCDLKVFDWKKAYLIIKDHPEMEYSAGLTEDWFWTGGTIWENGEKINSYCYLASNWATPVLRNDTTDEEIECWRYREDLRAAGLNWGSDTIWPDGIIEEV